MGYGGIRTITQDQMRNKTFKLLQNKTFVCINSHHITIFHDTKKMHVNTQTDFPLEMLFSSFRLTTRIFSMCLQCMLPIS